MDNNHENNNDNVSNSDLHDTENKNKTDDTDNTDNLSESSNLDSDNSDTDNSDTDNSDIDSDDSESDGEEEAILENYDEFDDMDFLSCDLLEGITNYGFKYPSPIQSYVIPLLYNNMNIIAQSQSGTGKTGAFTIGLLSKIDCNINSPQAVIVLNTKILAQQIVKVIEKIGETMNVKVCLCIGETKAKNNNNNSNNNGHNNSSNNNGHWKNAKNAKSSHILVGTPGRLGHILSMKNFNTKNIKTLVIDESDVLLKNDFFPQVDKIIKILDNNDTLKESKNKDDTINKYRDVGKIQKCIFSATFTKESLNQISTFMDNTFRLVIDREKISPTKIRQYTIDTKEEKYKYLILMDIYSKLTLSQVIIFLNDNRSASILRDKLMRDNIPTGMIIGNQNNDERENILRQFRLGHIKTLISTDVMSRGIDIDDLRCVINYDMPNSSETYIHRIGRSGRFGSEGIAINLVTNDDVWRITQIENDYKIKLEQLPTIDHLNMLLTQMKVPEYKATSSKYYE
jgi:superfamily II DNA/RNA helicase